MKHPLCLLIAALPFVPGPCEAETFTVETDCVSATATQISQSGGGTSIGGMTITSGDDCPKLSSAQLTLYRDKDGRPGYTNPPDQYVDQMNAAVSEPSGVISIGAFSNHSASNGSADSWELRILDASGGPSTFSGTF